MTVRLAVSRLPSDYCYVRRPPKCALKVNRQVVELMTRDCGNADSELGELEETFAFQRSRICGLVEGTILFSTETAGSWNRNSDLLIDNALPVF